MHIVFAKHLKYRRIIQRKTLKQINKTPIECSRERFEHGLQGRGHFFRHNERINFYDKAAKSILKNPTFEQKWLCNKLGVMKTWIFQCWKEILKRQNARSSKYQVHSARAHITVSSAYNDGRNMWRNAFSALTEHYMFL